jgi:hypothetical protein
VIISRVVVVFPPPFGRPGGIAIECDPAFSGHVASPPRYPYERWFLLFHADAPEASSRGKPQRRVNKTAASLNSGSISGEL